MSAPRHKSAVLLLASGELTIQTAPEIKAMLLTGLDAGKDIELDLSQVPELDTAGLQVLLLAKRAATERGLGFSVVAATQAVSEVLSTARLDLALNDTSCVAASEVDR
jgi:anti-anti-sigma factor